MSGPRTIRIAVVDYGVGNLFSVKHACEFAGMHADITSSRKEIVAADGVILPGVGAFSDAMANLHQLGLVEPLREVAESGRPLVGICLGMQLLMTESAEFGRHEGLGIVEGPVVRFERPVEGENALKVPQVGWNRLQPMGGEADRWNHTLLDGLSAGTHMYFVHSYYARPSNPGLILAVSRYGHIDFCSVLNRGNVVAFQCHPERSGSAGLRVYQNLAAFITRVRGEI